MEFREVKLPSGAVLKVAPAPFSDAKALYQAVLEESKRVDLGSGVEIPRLLKDALVSGFASEKIERCLWVCFQRCIYNSGNGDLKIDKDSFEPVKNRQDYVTVCMEVAEENIGPFVKSLYAVWSQALETLESVRASRQPTTTSSFTSESASSGTPAA